MSERECLKGWILAPSPTDGKDVPFFVKVRSEDIVWSTSDNFEELEKIANKGSNVQSFSPLSQWKFKKENWIVTLNQDATYTANIKVNIPREFMEEDTNTLRGEIKLPLEILNDENFTIQCTKMSDVYEIINSDITVLPEADDTLSSIELSIDYRNEENVFENFAQSTRFNNSFVCISITGKLNI